MNCRQRDWELLMLLHGELSSWRSLLVKHHLHRCASCRQRMTAYRSASVALANGVRQQSLPPWSFAPASGSFFRPASVRLTLAAALLLVLGCLAASYVNGRVNGHNEAPHCTPAQLPHTAPLPTLAPVAKPHLLCPLHAVNVNTMAAPKSANF